MQILSGEVFTHYAVVEAEVRDSVGAIELFSIEGSLCVKESYDLVMLFQIGVSALN